jgi:transposase
MSQRFTSVDYDAVLNQTIRVQDVLPEQHLARFIVGAIAEFELTVVYARYGERGGIAIAPEVLLGLLLYGYASGGFSSRKLERATYESIPFRYVAAGLHPDHDTIAHFRKVFLAEIKALFVQVLLLAQTYGVLKLGNVSLDGTKIHADASKSKAVSYQRAGELEARLRREVEELMRLAGLAEQADREGRELPPNLNVATEIAFRQERLANLAEAKQVLEARAQERYQAEQAAFEAKQRERDEAARRKGKPPRGRGPQPPSAGPRDTDQYNFTDPESRIMKNSTNAGFDQHYNAQVAAQVAVDQDSLLIVANTLSNHPTDQAEAIPTLEAMPPEVGIPDAAALDCGFFNARAIEYMHRRGIDSYIATGREPHHRTWCLFFAELPEPPAADASLRIKMAYKLQTAIGHAIYRLHKCTVEPVLGIIKEVLQFRQFSLRGLVAAAGEWSLMCSAFNLKRLHSLVVG